MVQRYIELLAGIKSNYWEKIQSGLLGPTPVSSIEFFGGVALYERRCVHCGKCHDVLGRELVGVFVYPEHLADVARDPDRGALGVESRRLAAGIIRASGRAVIRAG